MGEGVVSVLDGGRLHSYSGHLGSGAGAVGDLVVSGPGSTWVNDSHLLVGVVGQGTLTIADGGSVGSTEAHIGVLTSSTQGHVTVTGPGTAWENSGSAYIGGSPWGVGSGVLDIDDGASVTVGETLKVGNLGTVNLSGGTLDVSTIDHTGGGAFHVTGGSLMFDAFLGNLTNEGSRVSPGHSVGAALIEGDYIQQVGGTLRIEVDGAAEFDLLTVSGDVALAGLIEVVFNYVPTDPTTFEFLLADSISIGLLDWQVTGLSPSLFVEDFANGRFHVVPEPATVVFLLGGAAAHLLRRNTRKRG